MKIIPLKEHRLSYPVGDGIAEATYFVEDVYLHLKNKIKLKDNIVIWCRGSSGSILTTLLISKLREKFDNISFNYVRKEGERDHGSNSYLNQKLIKERNFINIIIDDQIATGNTLNEIWGYAKNYCEKIDYLLIGSHCSNIKSIGFIPDVLMVPKSKITESCKTLEEETNG